MPEAIVVINPNSTERITQQIRDAVSGLSESVTVVTSAEGPPAIETDGDVIASVEPMLNTADANRGAAAYVIACFSDPGLDELRQTRETPAFGIAESALRTVSLGIDHMPRDPGPDPLAGRPYLVALGTIEPRKNHTRMLEAWRRLPSPRPLLVVIGRPGWECTAAVEALGAEEQRGGLLWLRDADDQRAFQYLAHARAALYPSLLEGFGLPPLEAMSLGVPVLAGDTPALREVLEDSALFCDPTDVTSIAGCLQQLLEDQACRSELIRAGRQRASCFTWKRAAAGYVAAYREAAG